MDFLPSVHVVCETCKGKRYNRETLEVRFKGKSISDVLDLTVDQAVEFFEHQPKILNKISTLQDVGLGRKAEGPSAKEWEIRNHSPVVWQALVILTRSQVGRGSGWSG